jgi:hypothetical protein
MRSLGDLSSAQLGYAEHLAPARIG